MPSLSPTMTEVYLLLFGTITAEQLGSVPQFTSPYLAYLCMKGNIAKWMKKEGDKVSPGEVLCEVETVSFLILSHVKFYLLFSFFIYSTIELNEWTPFLSLG
jgi:hypothetical protein